MSQLGTRFKMGGGKKKTSQGLLHRTWQEREKGGSQRCGLIISSGSGFSALRLSRRHFCYLASQATHQTLYNYQWLLC